MSSETTRETVTRQVQKIVSEVVGISVEDLSPYADLIAKGIVDSMQALQIINEVERFFDIAISEEGIGNCESINAIVEEIFKLKSV